MSRMSEGRSRPGRAACVVVMALVLGAVGCGEQSSSEGAGQRSVVTSETAADPSGIQAAESTVRAFFAVKGRAEDPISVRIDEQAAYLTARDVHPSAASETVMRDSPSGITDLEVSVELSNARWADDDIQVDFDFDSTGVSYPFIDDKVQLDDGTPQESHWEGTATLENRNGTWLIDELSVESSGGEVS